MNQNQRNSAPVLARNCEIGCASFISGDIPRNHSPPGFLEFSFSKFQEIGGNDMYYDQKESGKRIAALPTFLLTEKGYFFLPIFEFIT